MPAPGDTKLVLCIWSPFTEWRFPAWLAEDIRKRYPPMRVVHLPDYRRLGEEIRDADILFGFSLKPEQFAAACRLKWIHVLAAGVNQLMREDIRRSDVVITNSRRVHAVPMAEHTLGLILALARRFLSAVGHQLEHHWAQQEIWEEFPRPMEINGRTLVIVGYGAIGREIARRAQACGMKVVGVKRDPARGREHADRVVGTDQLLAALAQADFVVLTLPLTEETNHFFGREEFAAMKKSAFFLNVSRGAVVDAEALVAALHNKTIAGAAIDVAEVEPLEPSSPLWKAPNLFITPHLSAVSERLWHRHAELLFENLDRYFSGRELLNVVDKKRGY
ncbi:D-2-hydroxyacid dehydrogenase [Acidobacteriia bacterium AH_259_A11_L15]|nr:D-2-hydroxyacid dehydrogenase [Acidobacteriia bacterium AH_259_A11_L15]